MQRRNGLKISYIRRYSLIDFPTNRDKRTKFASLISTVVACLLDGTVYPSIKTAG